MSRFAPPPIWRAGETLSHDKLNDMSKGVVRQVNVGPGLTKFESPDGSRVVIGVTPARPATQVETCWGKLTGRITDEGWEWIEVERNRATDGTVTWTTVTGGRSGANSRADPDKELAVTANKDNPGAHTINSIVLLRRTTTLRAADGEVPPTRQVNWAIINDPLTLFPVIVSQVGGIAGDLTNACTFTYDVATLAVEVIGTAMTPLWQRSAGKYIAGQQGTAYYNNAGELILHQVDEVRDTSGCP